MPYGRRPGPFGIHPNPIDSGTLARTQNQKPGAVGLDSADARKAADTPEMAKAKLEVCADIAQFILDLTGIVDPTPISDGLSGLISLARGNWLDAGISVVSFIPYLGDVAKTAKLPRYLNSVRKAVKIAKADSVWARRLKVLFEKLKEGLDKAYKELADKLPESARKKLKEIMDEVDDFLKPKGAPGASKTGSGSASGAPSNASGGSPTKRKKAIDEKPQGNYDGESNSIGPKTTTKIDDGLETKPLDPSKKPKNAPNIEKWEAKGGSVHQNSDGSVTYTDWEGNKVAYKDDVADFGPHSRKEVEIDEMVGDHYHDYKAANKKAGYGEGAYDHPGDTTWHHKDTTTMQNADSEIHGRFTHRGGVSKKKN